MPRMHRAGGREARRYIFKGDLDAAFLGCGGLPPPLDSDASSPKSLLNVRKSFVVDFPIVWVAVLSCPKAAASRRTRRTHRGARRTPFADLGVCATKCSDSRWATKWRYVAGRE